jgi:hypothetical protein
MIRTMPFSKEELFDLYDDIALLTVNSALFSSFLGSIVTHSEMGETVRALEYLLDCLSTGTHPPVAGWSIRTISFSPPLLVVVVRTKRNVEHILIIRATGEISLVDECLDEVE